MEMAWDLVEWTCIWDCSSTLVGSDHIQYLARQFMG